MSTLEEKKFPIYYQGPATNGVEFDFRTLGDGRSAAVRYANNSNYRNDSLIRKESESHTDLGNLQGTICHTKGYYSVREFFDDPGD